VEDRYRIDERIGVGGMGTVYRGTHVRLGQNVAIKVLHERYAGDQKLIRRFEKEALTYGQVSHPNLVGLHDFGRTEDGTFYMVLEYCPGVSLSKLIREQDRLDPHLAADLILQIAQGLSAAHKQGIIHRDLKPENVILTETRPGRFHARLLDFGIAKQIDDDGPRLTQAGMVFGTPEYMAPEQARGKPVDVRSDIYALGTMLYELLTGEPPFVGTDKLQIMHKQAHDVPPRPSAAVPGLALPQALEDIVTKAIEKLPANRFQKTSELIAALDGICRAERLTPEPLPRTKPVSSGPMVGSDSTSRLNSLVMRVSEVPLTIETSGTSQRVDGTRRIKSLTVPSIGAAAALFVIGVGITVFGFMGSSNDETKRGPAAKVGPPTSASGTVPGKTRIPIAKSTRKERPKQEGVAGKRNTAQAQELARKKAAARKQTLARKKALIRQKEIAQAKAKKAKKEAERQKLRAKRLTKAKKMLRIGKFDRAAAIVQKLHREFPKHGLIRTLRNQIKTMRKTLADGSLAYRSGHCAKAITSMKRVLKVAPKYARATAIIQDCRFASPPSQMN